MSVYSTGSRMASRTRLRNPGAAWSRRSFLVCAGAAACRSFWPADARTTARREAIGALLDMQHPDGAWRGTRGPHRRGHRLTGLALLALAGLPEVPAAALQRGLSFLTKAGTAGALGLGEPADHPTVATALAVRAHAAHAPAGWADTVAPWVAWLRAQQLVGAAWNTHRDLGGFSTGHAGPPTPDGAAPRVDLSATRQALTALRAAGALDGTSATAAAAKRYVLRCHTEDGSFRHSLGPPSVNLGPRPDAGYGTATCDAVLALHACGASAEAASGLEWLSTRFRVDENPGVGVTAWPGWGAAMRFAWRAAASEAFAAFDAGPWRWGDRMAKALLEEQLPGGGWVNAGALAAEDQPPYCTALGLRALRLAPEHK